MHVGGEEREQDWSNENLHLEGSARKRAHIQLFTRRGHRYSNQRRRRELKYQLSCTACDLISFFMGAGYFSNSRCICLSQE